MLWRRLLTYEMTRQIKTDTTYKTPAKFFIVSSALVSPDTTGTCVLACNAKKGTLWRAP